MTRNWVLLCKDVPEIIEGGFIPYDENLELVATQEEAAAFEENSVREEEERVMSHRRLAGEVETNTWYVLLKQPLSSY